MPPVESEADRASFFDSDEFAQVATIPGAPPINGYLDEQTSETDTLIEVPIQSTDPSFTCQFSLIPPETEEGTPISITRDDGTILNGTVITVEPDGFGMAVIMIQDNG